MRVLFVADMYPSPEGGISATFFHRQVVELSALGVEVRVLCPRPVTPQSWLRPSSVRPVRRQLEMDGISVTQVPYPKPVPFGWSASLGGHLLEKTLRREIVRLMRSFDFDLIHAVRLFPIVSSTLRTALACERPLLGLAVGSDVHSNPYSSRGIRRLTVLAIEGSDRVAAVSQNLAKAVAELGEPRKPVATIYNGVDAVTFAPRPERKAALRHRLGLPPEGTGLMLVSRLVRAKGLVELARAFEALASHRSDVWLAVVGDGPDRDILDSWVTSRQLTSRVFLAGAQPNDAVPDWLNAADVFVLPSHNEGLPNAVLEAMACGLPVVATDVGGTGEAVTTGETGYLVPPRSVEPLTDALAALVSNSSHREAFGRAGRERAVNVFSWRRSAESLVGLYEQMTAPH